MEDLMALWGVVKVNSEGIGVVDIQRLSPMDPVVGTKCRYRYVVAEFATDGERITGELVHPYGDWMSLYAAVMTAAATANMKD